MIGCLGNGCHGNQMPFYTESDFAPERSIGYLIRRAEQLGTQAMDPVFAAADITKTQWSALAALRFTQATTCAEIARDLGHDLKLIRAAGDRIAAALDAAPAGVAREDTLLMVVGRGTSDPDANSAIAKVTRLLWEGLGFGWAETGYSGVTFPLTEPALEHAARLGYRRIVVFPYFLFTGVLVKRIYHYTDVVAARHPDIEFVKAPYLNDHPLVLDTFAERVEEILRGDNAMNCLLCKYRDKALGFEDEVGLVQQSHHHHVEGIGAGADHGHGHDHHHGGNGHGHHPYPHADHPLGPRGLDPDQA